MFAEVARALALLAQPIRTDSTRARVQDVIVFSLTVGAYVTPRLLGGGRVQVLATEIFTQMLEIGDWGMAALLGAFLTIVTLLGIAIYQLFSGGPVRRKR